MSRINEKMGMRPAGKRWMMNLPDDPAERSSLTAAQCENCHHRGVVESVVHGKRMRSCSWCGHCWEPQ